MTHQLIPRIVVAAVLAVAIGAALVYAEKPGGHQIAIEAGDMEGQPYTIEELGALVVSVSGELQVLFVAPEGYRPKAYRDVDVQQGDRIMMINGSKVGSIDDLVAILSALEIGDEIKLGIKRDKDMKIASFPKADPADLPQVRRMVVSDDGAGGGPKMMMKGGGIEGEVAMLMGSGILAKPGEHGPVVGYLMPDAADMIGDADVQEGDRIVSVQGEDVDDLESLSAAWDKIEVGDPVEIVLHRGTREIRLNFDRAEGPKAGGMMMIKK